MLNQADAAQVAHIVRLAIAGSALRDLAGGEFDTAPEVASITFRVTRDGEFQPAIAVELLTVDGHQLAGFSL